MTVTDPCSATTLSIDPSILSSLSIQVNIGYGAHTETLDAALGSKVTTSPVVGAGICPGIVFAVQDAAGAAADPAIFSVSGNDFVTSSNDLTHAGTYSLVLVANFNGYSNTATLPFDVVLIDRCLLGTLSFITPLSSFTTSTYSLYKTPLVLSTDETEVAESETTAPCPLYQFDVLNQVDDSIADSLVFTQAAVGVNGFELTIDSSDTSKVGTYNLKLRTKYAGSYTNKDEVLFDVVIDDTCQSATLTMDPSLPTVYSYDIGYGDQVIQYLQTDVTTSDLSACPQFAFDVLNQDGTPLDPSLFAFSSVDSKLTVTDPNDLAMADTYPLRVEARYAGDASHYTIVATHAFSIVLIDKCIAGTLTISSSILTHGPSVTYNVLDPAYTLTLDPSQVAESETTAPCPSIVFSWENTDTTAVNAAIFSYDDASRVFLA